MVSQGRPSTNSPMRTNTKGSYKKPQVGARVFCLDTEEEETEDPNAVVTGTLLVNNLYIYVWFDSVATQSFINPEIAKKITYKFNDMDVQLCVVNPLGSIYHTDGIWKDYVINISGRILPADLIQLET